MTAILAVRRNGQLWLGGDRAMSCGDSVGLSAQPKIMSYPGYAIGYSGLSSSQASIRAMRPPRWTAGQDPQRWIETRLYDRLSEAGLDLEDSDYLIAIGGRMFHLVDNFAALEYCDDAFAIGNGGTVAQAVALALLETTKLSARTIVERALGYAERCVLGVKAGPKGFDVLRVG